MDIAVAVLLVVVSLFFIIKGGNIFITMSSSLAKRFKIPQVIIGATLVSFLTTLPELIIAIISGIQGVEGLSVGNSIGSFLGNIGIIGGVAFCMYPVAMGSKGVLKELYFIFVTIVFAVLCFWLEITIVHAIVLALMVAVFLAVNVIDYKTNIPKQTQENDILPNQPLWYVLTVLVLGAGMMGGGAYILVEKISFLADSIGVGYEFIGLTIIAMGTSLPELVITVQCIKKGAAHIAIGNIIGANILNLTLIISATKFSLGNKGLYISKETAYILTLLAVVFALVFMLPLIIKKRAYRWQGILLLCLYFLFVVYIVITTLYPIF